MLHRQPGIARHVKKLTLRPDFVSPRFIPNKSSPPNARLVTAAIKRTASCLDALQTFVWVGEEYPTEDDIWFVLRTSYVSNYLESLISCSDILFSQVHSIKVNCCEFWVGIARYQESCNAILLLGFLSTFDSDPSYSISTTSMALRSASNPGSSVICYLRYLPVRSLPAQP